MRTELSFEAAGALAESINSREGRFHARVFDAGSFSIVLLFERGEPEVSHHSPIIDPSRYLQLMSEESPDAGWDPQLQDVLRQWLAANRLP